MCEFRIQDCQHSPWRGLPQMAPWHHVGATMKITLDKNGSLYDPAGTESWNMQIRYETMKLPMHPTNNRSTSTSLLWGRFWCDTTWSSDCDNRANVSCSSLGFLAWPHAIPENSNCRYVTRRPWWYPRIIWGASLDGASYVLSIPLHWI